jgi:hypothetical protein
MGTGVPVSDAPVQGATPTRGASPAKNGSNQGRNLALAVLCVPNSLICRARREQFERFYGLVPESQDHILVRTIFFVPSCVDSGTLNPSSLPATLSLGIQLRVG